MTLTTCQRSELDITNKWIEYAKLIDDEDILRYHLNQKLALLDRVQHNLVPAPTPVVAPKPKPTLKSKRAKAKKTTNPNRDAVLGIALEFSMMSLRQVAQHKHKRLLSTLVDCVDFIINNPGCTTQDIYSYMDWSYNSGTLRGHLKALVDGGFPLKQIREQKNTYYTYYCATNKVAWYQEYKQHKDELTTAK